jgi:hypothetical protein
MAECPNCGGTKGLPWKDGSGLCKTCHQRMNMCDFCGAEFVPERGLVVGKDLCPICSKAWFANKCRTCGGQLYNPVYGEGGAEHIGCRQQRLEKERVAEVVQV